MFHLARRTVNNFFTSVCISAGSPWRLAGYRIYLSNTSTYSDRQPCYDDTTRTSIITTDKNVTRTECSGLAQFVTIYNDRNNYKPPGLPSEYESNAGAYTILELCEVQVFGTYGVNLHARIVYNIWQIDIRLDCRSHCVLYPVTINNP